MLYLIDPRGAVFSADTTLGRARAQQRVDGRPIDDLPFRRATPVLTAEDYVDLALRHGVPAPRGILLDHGFVEQVLAPSKLMAEKHNQEQIAAQLEPVRRFTEEDAVKLHRHDVVHEGAPRSLDRRISAAEDAARDLLQAEPKDELLRHWRGLGGTVPATIAADVAHGDAG